MSPQIGRSRTLAAASDRNASWRPYLSVNDLIAEYSPICRYASTRERKAHINHSGVGFGPHTAL